MKTSLIGALILLMTASACSKNAGAPDAETADGGGRIPVRFSVSSGRGPVSRAATCENEDTVADLNVWCYLDGKLDAFSYSEEGNCSVRLYDKRQYTVFAVANTGWLEPPFLEEDAGNYRYEFPDFATDPFRNALPMSTFSPVTVNTGDVGSAVNLEMTRLVSKYNLKTGKAEGTVSQLEIQSVKVKNSPSHTLLFGDNHPETDFIDGDCAIPAAHCNTVSLYLVENLQSSVLDENTCTCIEIKGRLLYEDRPRDDSVYVLNQDMTFRWYLKDSGEGIFGVRRNTDCQAGFSWSDFGWTSDPDHVNVDRINEEGTHCITFCDRNGIPLSGVVYDDLDQSSTIELYYRISPASDSSSTVLSTNIAPQSIHLSFAGKAEHIGDGIFRQRIENLIEREMPAEIAVSLTNAEKGICCSAHLKFSGSGNCVSDWTEEDDQKVTY